MIEKRKPIFGICRASSATNQPAAPQHTVICEDANIQASQKVYERMNLNRTRVAGQSSGYDLSFSASGIEPSIDQAGYTMAQMLGLDTITEGTPDLHVITCADNSQYVAAYLDRKTQVAVTSTSYVTEVALGGRLAALSIEQSKNAFAKMGYNGAACAYGTAQTALTRSTAPAAPLSWHQLRAGWFKAGWNGNAAAAVTGIQSFKVDFAQAQSSEDGILLAANQPSGIVEGALEVTAEFTMHFDGAEAFAAYAAQVAGNRLELQIRWVDGTNYLNIAIPTMEITGPFGGPIGQGTDAMIGTITARAYVVGAASLVTVTACNGGASESSWTS